MLYRNLTLITVLLLVCVSLPAAAQLAGNVTYTGTESGKIYVEAFTESDAPFEKLSVDMLDPGSFEFLNVSDGNYNVIAFVDVDGNARLDGGEPWVDAGSKIEVPPGEQNIDLNIDTYSPLSDGEEGDDGGCCATAAPNRRGSVLLLVGLIGLIVFRRRSLSRPNHL